MNGAERDRIRRSMELLQKAAPRATTELVPYERNQKDHSPHQVEQIAVSLRRFGWRQPIVVDGRGVIVIGHGRWMAAKKLGLETVPVVDAADLTADEIRELRIIDNKLNESPWNDFLVEDLQELTFEGFEDLFGEQNPETPESIDEIVEDDPPEAPEEPTAQVGQIWQLGEHRLMCGDSTDPNTWARLMAGEKADLVFTDPPYGVAIGDKNAALNEVQKAGCCTTNIMGDAMSEDELYQMLVQAMSRVRENCAPDASYYVSSPQGGSLGLMMMMMRDAGLPVRHMLIWVKNSATFSLGRLDYDYRHEPIFYTWTESHHFRGGYSTTVIDDSTVIDKMGKTELRDLCHALLERKPDTVIYCDKPMKCDLHPTMKPVKLVARFIVNSSEKGQIVLDAFGGSGTTIIAAEQLGRKARVMELDPHYCDVIIRRWEQLTGGKAVLLAE